MLTEAIGTVDVSPFTDQLGVLKSTPICHVAVAVDLKEGETMILIFNYVLVVDG